MNSIDDDSSDKKADTNVCLRSDSNDFGSDFEIITNGGGTNNNTLVSESNGSELTSLEEVGTPQIPKENGNRFGIMKKLRAFASMKKKNPEKKRTPRPQTITENVSKSLPSNINNPEKSSKAADATGSSSGVPDDAGVRRRFSFHDTFATRKRKDFAKKRTTQRQSSAAAVTISLPSNLRDYNSEEATGAAEVAESNSTVADDDRKKWSFQETSASKRDHDTNKKKTPLQRSNTEIVRGNVPEIRISYISLPEGDGNGLVKPVSTDPLVCQESTQRIIEEFIETEESYIAKLWKGIENYGQLFQRPDLPETLQRQEYALFANIEDIARFHRDQLLPMLQRHRDNAKRIFMELLHFIEQKYFHIYVLYTINKQRSMQLIVDHRSYFDILEKESGDRLGISSFLLQPIQRLARYPLLLAQFISTLFKQLNPESRALMSTCCRLDTRIRALLNTINESECINDIAEVDVTKMFNSFRRVGSFEIYDHLRKRSYSGKVFLFDKCLILSKIVGKQLMYRRRYNCAYVQIMAIDQGFSLFYKYGEREEQKCDFKANPVQVELWLKLLHEVVPLEPDDASQCEYLEEEGAEYSPPDSSKVSDFDIYDYTLERKYPAKVFLCEMCIIYAEVIETRLKLRGSYPFDHVGVSPSDGCFTLFYDRRNQQKCDFKAEPVLIKEWLDLIHGKIKSHFKRKMSISASPGPE